MGHPFLNEKKVIRKKSEFSKFATMNKDTNSNEMVID